MTALPLRFFAAALLFTLCATPAVSAQRPAPTPQPGVVSRVTWSDDGSAVSWTNLGTRYRMDLADLEAESLGADQPPDEPARTGRRTSRTRGASTGTYVGRPGRGRQYTQVDSPNGAWEAHYRDWNLVLVSKTGQEAVDVTTDGNADIHYGTASWVYGEELGQRRAMWWTPDSSKIVFYRFDDRGVEPFHLVTGWSDVGTRHYPEFYPKAGAKNPVASLLVYDIASGKTTPIETGAGPEDYLYNVHASPKGAMLVYLTDRLQQKLQVLAMDLNTGACRTIIEEHQDTWQTNKPMVRYLEDGKRFLWATDKSGYTHYELRDLRGARHATITSGEFQTGGLQFVDEEAGLVGFTGYSSAANPYFLQYHLVGLDGTGQRRVTTLDAHHSNFQLSPDRKWLVAQHEDVNTPPSTVLYSSDGEMVATLAAGDPESAANLAEMFTFRSEDGRFNIYAVLYKPADFDPEKSYPLINALYAGPGSREVSARYVGSVRAECARGYLVLKVGNRGNGGRGKDFLGAVYRRLGDVDIQDHADAVRLVAERPYVDGSRVGIVGHSYGGYMAAMGVFKHPDVYTAAVVGSGVTDWRNYDTIYTERYMSTPQLNEAGYDIGAAMTYVDGFRGHVLIMHGMVDDNVHPTNAFQLIAAMDKVGKPYESRFFPNSGHGLGRGSRQTQWEFFDRILKPGSDL